MTVSNPVGWLPYGSSDASVLFYHPLTTTPTNTTIPCTTLDTVGTGSITHDATLGALFNGKSYRIAALTNADNLFYGGQISFQVQRAWISTYDASGTASGSTGTFTNQTQAAISLLTTSGHLCRWPQRTGTDTTGIGLLHFNAAVTQKNPYTAASSTPCINSNGKDEFVTVNIGWVGSPSGGRWYLAIDGLLVSYWDSAVTGVSGLGALWYLGSDRGSANTFVSAHYMRNLQISSRPPMLAIHPKLRKLVLWGDSKIKDLIAAHFVGNPYYDAAVGLSCVRKLASRGLYCGDVVAQSNGGYTVTDLGATQLQSVRATLLAANPTVVCMSAGTNDVDSDWATYSAQFETDLKDHISTIMAYSTVEMMIIGNVPSRYYGDNGNTYTANVLAANAIYAGIENWWDTTGAVAAGVPGKVGMVKVVDTYNCLGGANPPPKTFIGQLTGLNNDVHYASYGHYLQGKQFGEGILALLK